MFYFKLVQDYDTEQRYISPRFNNGDWNYYLIMHIMDMHEMTGDKTQPKYYITVDAVSPTAARKEIKNAMQSYGLEPNHKLTYRQKALILHEYGTSATLYQAQSNNKNLLLKEARKDAQMIEAITFGFRMDSTLNMIGSTGWDFIKGDINAGLRRWSKEHKQQKQQNKKVCLQ
jgi:hypothetical protein